MNMLSIGADPEVFVTDGHQIVSSIGRIDGSKKKPHPLGAGYFIQSDNVLAEYNIPPARTVEEFIENVGAGLARVRDYVRTRGLDVVIKTSHFLDWSQLCDPAAFEFGCAPDYNAWSGARVEPPRVTTNLRCAGGHIHVAYPNPSMLKSRAFVCALDLFLGVPSVLLDPDTHRRGQYGAAGAFRPKKYGLEYRTLSSFWIKNPLLIRWVWEQTHAAWNFIQDKAQFEQLNANRVAIQHAINACDVGCAKALCNMFNITYPEV